MIGVLAADWAVPLAPSVIEAMATAREALVEAGCRVVEVEIEGAAGANAWYTDVLLPEVKRVHERLGLWPARQDEYGADVRARVAAGGEVSFDAHLDAWQRRRELTERFAAALRDVDAILSPPSAVPPVPILLRVRRARPPRPPLPGARPRGPFCTPQSLAGVPVVSVPVGRDADGLPTAVSTRARAAGDDRRLLRLAGLLGRALA